MFDDPDEADEDSEDAWDESDDEEELDLYDQAWDIAVNDHPEYQRGLENGTLPEEVVDEHGNLINPRLHLEMHAIIERQLAADEPEGVVEIAGQLEAQGVSRHEIRHLMAEPLVGQIWDMLQGNEANFDERRYLRELRGIVRKRSR